MITGTGANKPGGAINYTANEFYKSKIGNASNEIFALFMARIYDKLPYSIHAQFSTLKFIQGTNFIKFKEFFLAKNLGGFVVPSYTFDNVKGSFPVGFTIWDFKIKEKIKQIECDVYDEDGIYKGKKYFMVIYHSINKWLLVHSKSKNNGISILSTRNDFQNQKYII